MSHYDEQREQAESKAMRPKYQRMKDLRALISAAEAGGREHNPHTIAQAKDELNMLKADTKEEYIKSNGSHCPHCGSKSISAGGLKAEGGEAWQENTCDTCGGQWNDIYKLCNIEKITGDVW